MCLKIRHTVTDSVYRYGRCDFSPCFTFLCEFVSGCKMIMCRCYCLLSGLCRLLISCASMYRRYCPCVLRFFQLLLIFFAKTISVCCPVYSLCHKTCLFPSNLTGMDLFVLNRNAIYCSIIVANLIESAKFITFLCKVN
jgi:hypothetical protein